MCPSCSDCIHAAHGLVVLLTLAAAISELTLFERTAANREVGNTAGKPFLMVFKLHADLDHGFEAKPAIAQLVEHLTVDVCSNQMVPGSIPGGRIFF